MHPNRDDSQMTIELDGHKNVLPKKHIGLDIKRFRRLHSISGMILESLNNEDGKEWQ